MGTGRRGRLLPMLWEVTLERRSARSPSQTHGPEVAAHDESEAINMQILLSFLIGYFVGAKAGEKQFDEVVESARAVAESEEFHSLLMSLRAHASAALHALGDLLEEAPRSGTNDSVVARVRRMMEQPKSTAF